MLAAEIIKKKRNGLSLNREEIRFVVDSFVDESLPPYQMAAWLMAVYFKGLDPVESSHLTQAMIDSGESIDFSSLGQLVCDKHSTGGVGDKASLILAPIAAACGLHVPMVAGRGLGHTGGTLDKLESIPGFDINLKIEQFRQAVIDNRLAIIGQTQEICPADKKMYALRDVTATVESLGLIGGSIMSKKIAEGIRSLALDVKVGSGAFMKTAEDAEELARFLMQIGREHDVRVAAYLTNMNQPLGRFIGNSLEIFECHEILRGEKFVDGDRDFYADTRELSIELAALMMFLTGKANTIDQALENSWSALNDGSALKEFEAMISRQGGRLEELPKAPHQLSVRCNGQGYLSALDTEKIGVAGIVLGAGRAVTADTIQPSAGIEVHRKIGDWVERDDVVFTLYAEDSSKFTEAEEILKKSVTLSLQPAQNQNLIMKRLLP